MNYPNKPHFKILTSVLLSCLQYFLLTSEFIATRNQQGQITSFGILTLNALLLSFTIGSVTMDIKNQLKNGFENELYKVESQIQNQIIVAEHKIQNSIEYLENEVKDEYEKFEHVVLDEATLLLGSKVYRPNPILAKFD